MEDVETQEGHSCADKAEHFESEPAKRNVDRVSNEIGPEEDCCPALGENHEAHGPGEHSKKHAGHLPAENLPGDVKLA